MANAVDLKSSDRNVLRVRVPSLLKKKLAKLSKKWKKTEPYDRVLAALRKWDDLKDDADFCLGDQFWQED